MVDSGVLKVVLQAGYEKTAGQFLNLTKTTANTATFQFERALDRAYMQITMGGFDYNTAIRNTIKELSKDGVGAIRYPSGADLGKAPNTQDWLKQPVTEQAQDSEDGIAHTATDRGLKGCLEHTARICWKSTMRKTLSTTARS